MRRTPSSLSGEEHSSSFSAVDAAPQAETQSKASKKEASQPPSIAALGKGLVKDLKGLGGLGGLGAAIDKMEE